MLTKLIIQILTNAVAIYIAARVVNGFTLNEEDFKTLFTVGFIFGMINFFIKPVLKLISVPLIFFTLGLFTIVINIVMLLLLDYFVPELIISGLGAAFWGTIVISAVNFFVGGTAKSSK